jgi:hypothetical protein
MVMNANFVLFVPLTSQSPFLQAQVSTTLLSMAVDLLCHV